MKDKSTVLTMWRDLVTNTKEYEWLEYLSSEVFVLDFSNMKDKKDFKMYIANTQETKDELDILLMLWLGLV